jgi:hypothetical protein
MVSGIPEGGDCGRLSRLLGLPGLVVALSLSVSSCALHWPWKRRPPPPPQPVHQLLIVPEAPLADSAILQFWDRNTLLVDLTAVGAEGAATLRPIKGLGWPIRLEFRVRPGTFGLLTVSGAQRVIFQVPSEGAPVLLRLAPSAVHADTGQVTLRWSAADDSAH